MNLMVGILQRHEFFREWHTGRRSLEPMTMRDEPAIILDGKGQEGLFYRAAQFWAGLNRTTRIVICVLAAIVGLGVLSVSSGPPKADEQAIRTRFPSYQSITLYHGQGNVPQPPGVDWSSAREYRVRDNTPGGRWSVIILDGKIIEASWVGDSFP